VQSTTLFLSQSQSSLKKVLCLLTISRNHKVDMKNATLVAVFINDRRKTAHKKCMFWTWYLKCVCFGFLDTFVIA